MTIMFSRIEGNGWKFSHIELSINVIRYIVSNSVAVHHKTMADLLDAVVGVDQSGVVGRGGDERGGGQVYYTAAGIMMRIYRQSTLSQNNLNLRIKKLSLPRLKQMQWPMSGFWARYMCVQKPDIFRCICAGRALARFLCRDVQIIFGTSYKGPA